MPELSDGDDDAADDEEQWQWMEEGDPEQVNVPCLFCDRWDYVTVNLNQFRKLHCFTLSLITLLCICK